MTLLQLGHFFFQMLHFPPSRLIAVESGFPFLHNLCGTCYLQWKLFTGRFVSYDSKGPDSTKVYLLLFGVIK